jgi:tRNA pseudouridine38-40 synthase
MPRYKLTIEYDGTPYHGWQRQEANLPSVQAHIEDAIFKTTHDKVVIHCSGRTDAGVHAMGQVAHVDLSKHINPFSLMQGINYHLKPERIVIHQCEAVSDQFHARFQTVRRHYMYRIINRSARLGLEENRMWQIARVLDIEKMREGAQHLLGTHDFSSFRDSDCQSKSPIKTLERIELIEVFNPLGREIQLHTSSKSFLHHQVRIMTGTLALVGYGKWQPDDVRTALEAKCRTKGGFTAPAEGLYFMRVEY